MVNLPCPADVYCEFALKFTKNEDMPDTPISDGGCMYNPLCSVAQIIAKHPEIHNSFDLKELLIKEGMSIPEHLRL